jgi:hypothetical protein
MIRFGAGIFLLLRGLGGGFVPARARAAAYLLT